MQTCPAPTILCLSPCIPAGLHRITLYVLPSKPLGDSRGQSLRALLSSVQERPIINLPAVVGTNEESNFRFINVGSIQLTQVIPSLDKLTQGGVCYPSSKLAVAGSSRTAPYLDVVEYV